MNFLAPSHLDYSAYCTTRVRDGIANGSEKSAMACVIEAKEWKERGTFDVVTCDTVSLADRFERVTISLSKLSVKHAIHGHYFVICELKGGMYVIATGYDGDGVTLCHPSDGGYGFHGKKSVKWSDFTVEVKRAFYLF